MTLPGPSLATLDLDKLRSRGIVTMGVNNSPATWRPNFWTHVDEPLKFHSAIWFDPGILKFVPKPMLNRHIRIKRPNGQFRTLRQRAGSQPGVFGYQRIPVFNPETYLTENAVCWGNNLKHAQLNGHPHILNVMFVVLKLAYYLGFRTVYLLGCDFKMSPAGSYSFPYQKDEKAAASNNGSYCKLNHMFNLLNDKFVAAGYQIYNCNPDSNCLAFPHKDFDHAIADATRATPAVLDTEGWYTKPAKPDPSD